jgi:hypothetical protein
VCRAAFHSIKDELLERVQLCFERSVVARESFFTPKGEFDYGVARFSWFALGQQWLSALVRFAPSLAHLTALLGGISADASASSSSSSSVASAVSPVTATTRWLELAQDTCAIRVGGASGAVSCGYPLHSFEQVHGSI